MRKDDIIKVLESFSFLQVDNTSGSVYCIIKLPKVAKANS